MPSLYILQLINQKYYIGSTKDIEKRLVQHQKGTTPSTKNYLPVEIVFNQVFDTLKEARRAEIWLKKQKSHTFINRIINEGRLEKTFRSSAPVNTGEV